MIAFLAKNQYNKRIYIYEMQNGTARDRRVFAPTESPAIRVYTMMLDFKQAYLGAEAVLSDEDQEEAMRIANLPIEEQAWALGKWNIKIIKENEPEKDTELKKLQVANTRIKTESILKEKRYKNIIRKQEKAIIDLEKLVRVDPLTEVHNRRFLKEFLGDEIKAIDRQRMANGRANEHHKTLSVGVLMLDLDHFKKINDTDGLGHAMGDLAIKEFTSILRKILRPGDTITRWGGEEFVVTLKDTSRQDSQVAAEKIRKSVEAQLKENLIRHIKEDELYKPNEDDDEEDIRGKERLLEEKIRLIRDLDGTVSIGVTSYSTDDAKLSNVSGGPNERNTVRAFLLLVEQADIAMFDSKKNGRNRVTVFTSKPIGQKKKNRPKKSQS